MKIIALFFLFFTSFALNAETLIKVETYKYTDSLDPSFFQYCLDNAEPAEGMLKCRVFQTPKDLKILKDGGLLGAMNFVVVWSQTHCSIDNREAGRLYLRTTSSSADIFFHNERCIEIMRDAVEGNENFMNKSLYLIKKDQ